MTWIPDTKTIIYRSRRSWHTKRNFEVYKATDFLTAAIELIPLNGQQTIRYNIHLGDGRTLVLEYT